MYYKDFYNDLAKLYGASSSPVVVADSWLNVLQWSTINGNQMMDLRVDGGNPVPFGALAPKCAFFGYWSILITQNVFAIAGDLTVNSYKPKVGGINIGGYGGSLIAYKAFAALSTPTFADYYQYDAAVLSNVMIGFPTGAGNSYIVSVIFDGVRINWGS